MNKKKLSFAFVLLILVLVSQTIWLKWPLKINIRVEARPCCDYDENGECITCEWPEVPGPTDPPNTPPPPPPPEPTGGGPAPTVPPGEEPPEPACSGSCCTGSECQDGCVCCFATCDDPWNPERGECSAPSACICFTGETKVKMKDGKEQEIRELKVGDEVVAFDPETGEDFSSRVTEVRQAVAEGYYVLKTESGKIVEVTGEHPFLALKSENNPSSAGDSGGEASIQLLDKVKSIFSQTPIYKAITGLQTKVSEVLK